MIQTLARIAGYAAKGVYAFLLLKGGSATRKEIITEGGYKNAVLHEAVVSLEAAGFVVRIGGMYRVVSSGMPEQCSAPPESQKCSGLPEQCSAPPETVVLFESRTKRKYTRRNSAPPEESYGRPEQCSAPPEDLSKSPLTLVNDSSNKQEKKRRFLRPMKFRRL